MPAGSVSGVITIGVPIRIVGEYGMDSAGVAASVAVIVTVDPPGFATVGVPLICPVLGLIANPNGRPLVVQMYGVVQPFTAKGFAT